MMHRLEKGRKPLPSTPIYDNIYCTHPQVSGYILYKDLRERNLLDLENLEGLTSLRSM